MPTPLVDYAGLSAERRTALEAVVGRQTLLAHVITWAGPTGVEEIVTQDEYTHDVLVPYERELYLVYDST
jgi:hypothetical protein